LIETCKSIADNSEKAIKEHLTVAINKELDSITEKTKKHCMIIEQSANKTKSSLMSLNTIVVGCIAFMMVLWAGNFYMIYHYTSERQEQMMYVDEVLRGQSKYWWDDENKKLYVDDEDRRKK